MFRVWLAQGFPLPKRRGRGAEALLFVHIYYLPTTNNRAASFCCVFPALYVIVRLKSRLVRSDMLADGALEFGCIVSLKV